SAAPSQPSIRPFVHSEATRRSIAWEPAPAVAVQRTATVRRPLRQDSLGMRMKPVTSPLDYPCEVEPDSPVVSLALSQALQSANGLLDRLPVSLYACDLDGRLVEYNKRAAEMWGQEPPVDADSQFSAAHRLHAPDGKALAPADMPMSEV